MKKREKKSEKSETATVKQTIAIKKHMEPEV